RLEPEAEARPASPRHDTSQGVRLVYVHEVARVVRVAPAGDVSQPAVVPLGQELLVVVPRTHAAETVALRLVLRRLQPPGELGAESFVRRPKREERDPIGTGEDGRRRIASVPVLAPAERPEDVVMHHDVIEHARFRLPAELAPGPDVRVGGDAHVRAEVLPVEEATDEGGLSDSLRAGDRGQMADSARRKRVEHASAHRRPWYGTSRTPSWDCAPLDLYRVRLTRIETRRRVAIPLSRLSPGFRARTNKAIRPCFRLTGKPDKRWNVSAAHPSDPVGVSGGTENWLKGVAVA